MSEYDFENSRWKYDIETYYRAKLLVSKLDIMGNANNRTTIRDFWRDRANRIVDKYPGAKLEKVV